LAPGAPCEEPQELATALKNQIEFYFGNSNLSKDKFLRKLLDKNDILSPFNCVKASAFLDFNKIKEIFRANSSQVLTAENRGLLRSTTEIEGIRIKKEDIYRNNKEYQSFDDEKKI
jgi:hypothetical protein